MSTLDIILQTGAFVCGATSIYLVGRKDKWQRYGYIIGLCGQPFWVAISVRAEQWIVLVLTTFYAFGWAKGVYNYWIKQNK